MGITNTPAWQRLLAAGRPEPLRALFSNDPRRAERLTFPCADLRVDLSKNWLTDDLLARLMDVARVAGVEARRDAMFRGEPVNATERRAALHTALRAPRDAVIETGGRNVMPEVHEVLDRMSRFCRAVRSGAYRGVTGRPITTVVNIGIGGSDLGPAMAYEALRSFVDGPECRFVSNVDAADLAGSLRDLDAETTLFVISSKTFTTIETLTNARSARRWLESRLGTDRRVIAQHVVAVSTNTAETARFGIDPHQVFGFWDWVGGRYSIDSAIGLSLMLAIGPERFGELLAGMRDVDEHFAHTALDKNVPVLMGLLGVWYTSVCGAQSKAVLPYSHELRRLPAYLQQLDMESNGKSVRTDGEPVDLTTGPVVWGEPGTNGQHAFFQLLHQGSWLVPCDFIGFARPNVGDVQHQDLLISNLLAQAEALAFGRSVDEVLAEGVPEHQVAHRVFPGNRPSTMVLAERLSPRVLGELVALYEHVVFVQGVVWGVNSFDQWGVELGKTLANRIVEELSGAERSPVQHDSSTTALIEWYRTHRQVD